jgi:hypothetical protein
MVRWWSGQEWHVGEEVKPIASWLEDVVTHRFLRLPDDDD